MKPSQLHTYLWIVPLAFLVGLPLEVRSAGSAAAQALTTGTPVPAGGQAYITNTFEGEPSINVRVGPSTIIYPLPCGLLPFGATAPALGTTPAHEWVQIAFAACPGGVGWVYAANVTLSGTVRIVELPPTSTPLATATFDPTLVAAFQVDPTQTRLPTFTPPPPLTVPAFVEEAQARTGPPTGVAIIAAVVAGGLVLAASFVGRR
jgi:uncharacterized protein YraI